MEGLRAVLARAMSEQAEARFPTALAFASALEAAARGQVPSDVPPLPAPAFAPPPTAVGPVAVAAGAGDASRADLGAPSDTGEEPVAPDDEEREDGAEERDDGEAPYLLTLGELDEAAPAASEARPDAEIDGKADADRFLLDVAGAASHPEVALDDLRPSGPVQSRALDDEAKVGERPSSLFHEQHLLDDTKAVDGRQAPDVRPQEYHPSFDYSSPSTTSDADRRSPWPIALVLLFGLLVGFVGGYAIWGRSASGSAGSSNTAGANPSAGREFSEQAIVPPAGKPTPPATPSGSSPSAGGSASPPTGGASTTAAAPPAATPAAPPPPAPTADGTIIVRSNPTGAAVTLNGRWSGRTPLTLEKLAFARYQVRVVQPGYATESVVVVLNDGDPSRSLSFRLRQQSRAAPRAQRSASSAPASPASAQTFSGSIFVDSNPRGARVSIDGKPVGVTPLRIPNVRIGSHVVRLELPDYRIWSSSARVTAGQEARVTGSLERIR
ncbi:MAG: PEGA domain-containing protein, partial [Vicinamibacterales bacterium]